MKRHISTGPGRALIFGLLLVLAAACAPAAPTSPMPAAAAQTAKGDVILATTTSTQDSGLLDVLVPRFNQQTGYNLKTIAVGTGQALAMGARGEADVLLVHAPDAELKEVDAGNAVNRLLVMHNDFVVVGPPADPAKIKGAATAQEALAKIAAAKADFTSRGDNSGTHQLELKIWQQAKLDPKGKSWYREAGQGMGQTLTIAAEKNGYTITDRATYLARKGTLQLTILVEGEKSLLNIYHVMQVNPQKFPKVNAAGGKAFADFMVSPAAQEVIGKFGVDKYGQQLFFADAGKDESTLG